MNRVDFSNVKMGDIKGAWAVTAKTLPPDMTPEDVETMRRMFYMGAITVHAIINNAAKLPSPFPEKVINAMDQEIDEFKGEMHAIAQKAADAARAKSLIDETAPGGSPAIEKE